MNINKCLLKTNWKISNSEENAGVRPFGVSFLIAGIDSDNGTSLYLTDPSGAMWGYKAFAIGSGATEARAYLEEHYKEDMSDEELKLLPLKALKELMGDNLSKNTCDVAFILKEDQKFKLLNLQEKEEILNKL